MLATNLAKLFGLYPRKGCIAIGADADLVVFDPKKKVKIGPETIHMNVDYTPYDGWEVTGRPVVTIVRGKVVCQDGQFLGTKGYGQYLSRASVMDLL